MRYWIAVKSPSRSKIIQKILGEYGYGWEREKIGTICHTEKSYLTFGEKNKNICWSSMDPATFSGDFREIKTIDDLIQFLEEQPIKIDEYKVGLDECGSIQIGCHKFGKSDINSLIHLVQMCRSHEIGILIKPEDVCGPKKTIGVSYQKDEGSACIVTDVPVETLEQIADLANKLGRL